jgi:hypothetical protein
MKPAIEFEPRRGTTIRMDREVQRKLAVILTQRNRDLPKGEPRVSMSQLVREWVSDEYLRLREDGGDVSDLPW